MKQIKMLLLLVVLVGTLSECKKGPDDPFISFRTRKSRVVGEWILTGGTAMYSSVSGSPAISTTDNFTYTEKNYSYTSVTTGSFGGTSSGAGVFSMKIKFTRDGKYTLDEQMDGNFYHEDGEWNFTKGVGDLKNKEQITLSPKNTIDNSNSGGMRTNSRGVTQSFRIKELRNRKMVIYDESTENDMSTTTPGNNSTSSSNSSKTEWTLEQPKHKDK